MKNGYLSATAYATVGSILRAEFKGDAAMKVAHTLAVAALVASGLAGVPAWSEPVSIHTRFGDLANDPTSGKLSVSGRAMAPAVYALHREFVIGTYQLPNADAVLVQLDGGNECPGQFRYITVTRTLVTVSPRFGTCFDDDVHPQVTGQSIAFRMTKLGGQGATNYVFDHGAIWQDGVRVAGAALDRGTERLRRRRNACRP
jgi:hypothetical protein